MNKNKFILRLALSIALAFTFSCSSGEEGESGCKSDKGNKMANYEKVRIGTQTWMAENLNYNVSGSKCSGNSEANGEKYGRLYDWETAKTVCPSGWRLPNDDDWDKLISYVESNSGCKECAGRLLKATSGWDDWAHYNDPSITESGNGTDDYGFSALPGGLGSGNGYFGKVGSDGYWWSASEYDSYSAYYRGMYYDENVIYNKVHKSLSQSVRCLQN
jgi:uncharacterized protein (TIGR02145 family)